MTIRLNSLTIGILVGAWATGAFLLFSQSIRLDESQSIWVATKSVSSILATTAQDVHVPLYGLLLHFWMQLFGSSILAARSLSFIFFLIAVPALYNLASTSSSKNVAALTVGLFAFSPFIMWFTSEARMYTLFTLVTILSHTFFLQIIRSHGREGKIYYLLTTVAGLHSHYFFLLVVGVQVIYIFAVKRKLIFTFLPLVFLAFLSFIPWLAYVIQGGSAANTRPLIPPPTSFNILQTFTVFLFGFQSPLIESAIISLWPLVIVLLFFIFTRRETELPLFNINYFFLATFVPVIILFAASYIRPIFLSRYLIFVTPTLFIILAWLILANLRKSSTYLITLIVVLLFALLFYQNLSQRTPVREDYRAVSEYLLANATPHDVIATSPPFTVYPLEYSYNGNTRITTIPEWDRYTEGPIPAYSQESTERQLAEFRQQYLRLFLVLSYNQGYEKELRDFFDKRLELIGEREFASGIQLLEYKIRYDSIPQGLL